MGLFNATEIKLIYKLDTLINKTLIFSSSRLIL